MFFFSSCFASGFLAAGFGLTQAGFSSPFGCNYFGGSAKAIIGFGLSAQNPFGSHVLPTVQSFGEKHFPAPFLFILSSHSFEI